MNLGSYTCRGVEPPEPGVLAQVRVAHLWTLRGRVSTLTGSYPTVWCFNIVPPAIPDRADGDGHAGDGTATRVPRAVAGRMEKFQSFVGPGSVLPGSRGGSRRPIRGKRKLNPDVLVRPHPARLTRLTSAVSHSRSAPAVSSARLVRLRARALTALRPPSTSDLRQHCHSTYARATLHVQLHFRFLVVSQ